MLSRWRHSAVIAALSILVLSFSVPSAHAAGTGLAGHWEGAIEIPGTKLGIDVDFKPGEGGAWTGDISIPLQNAKDLPLTGIKLEGNSVAFEIQGIPGSPTFHGALDGDKIAGDFEQGGGKFPFSLARAAAPAEAAKDALAGYDAFVDKMIVDWKVPGLAIAIVKGGEVVYAQGFGYRDVEQKLPVTPDTLFAIGSSTKAFTTFTLGTLVDEGKLDWDKPVRTFIPGFQMYDPQTTALITPRDLVTHRSGLPRHDLLWYNNSVSTRKDLVERLRYLEPNEQLRAKWQYNNLMFLTAGYLVEVVTGKSWEDNVRERIFQPLGMTHSNFSVAESQKAADFALPYREDDDTEKVNKIPFRNIDLIGPAGSINSSANDMTKWLKIHLSGGKLAGKQIIGAATLEDLHAPHMVIGAPAERPEITPASYALGWVVQGYRGHTRVEHGGNIDGFSALVTLFPQDDLGIVILTNLDGTGVPERLVRHTADRLLKLSPIDWNGEDLAKHEIGKKTRKEAKAKRETMRKPGTKPAHKLAEYAGDYENPGYGILKVAVAGDHLEATYHDIVQPLEHWHYEVWNGKEGAKDPTLQNVKFLFQGDLKGNVASVAAQFEPQVKEIVFTKKADPRLSDPAWLARYVGEYELSGETARVEQAGSTLTLSLSGQPLYHLVPGLGEFTLKELPVVSASFVEDAQGKVTAVTFNQPNGVFTAKKK
ncbi:MAG TPA: serine hydrolase [Thermoanaerobaculia bacterium]|nr:serine hydrolase [Thermoanaerobaculia bacterium]